ncbi:MAG TPA: SDR family oxidoreductase, partial [Acidimicrobiales bacterium]|nr:SDR family oxidoreductase [Acidimicrobiales bacterium]
MELKGRVAVVTGGGSGIGRALCHRFAAEGARAVVVADLDEAAAAKVAEETKTKSPAGEARAAPVDVADEAQVSELVRQVEDELGPIDLFFSNAGLGGGGGVEATDETWDRLWRVHVMAHVYAARAVLPGMLARGEGYLLHTASAAGLLTNLGNAAYSVTK